MSDSLSETMNDSLAKALRDLNVDLDAIRAEIESTSHWNPDPHYLDASRARDSRRYPWSNGELEVGYHNVSVPKGLGYVPVDAFAQKDKIDTHFYIPYPDAVDVPYNLQAEQLYDTIPSPYGNFIHVQSAADSNPRRGFGRQSNKAPQQQNKGGNAPSPSYQTAPSMASSSSQNLPNSPALSATMSFENVNHSDSGNQHRNPPFFFREQYANLIVKGNFMTLAAKPVLIEEGEWLAHQGMSSLLSLVLLSHPKLLSSIVSTASYAATRSLLLCGLWVGSDMSSQAPQNIGTLEHILTNEIQSLNRTVFLMACSRLSKSKTVTPVSQSATLRLVPP